MDNKITLMSYNILCDKPEPDRIDRLIKTVKKYSADTIGMQEVTPFWLEHLKPALADDYICVGLGRDGGSNGEHSCIFYNKHKFNLIDTQTKWLTDTPDEVSKLDCSDYIRVATYALLERKSDGKRFVHINTHIDYVDEAMIPQINYLKKYADKYMEYPMLATGDFNFTPDSAAYAEMTRTIFSDSSKVAEDPHVENTFSTPFQGGSPCYVIDYCFVTADKINTKFYKVCTDQIDGSYGSDHFPIYVEYELKD